jgi:hypothetical protein
LRRKLVLAPAARRAVALLVLVLEPLAVLLTLAALRGRT